MSIKTSLFDRFAGLKIYEYLKAFANRLNSRCSSGMHPLAYKILRILDRYRDDYRRLKSCVAVISAIRDILDSDSPGHVVKSKLLSFIRRLRFSDCPIRGFLSDLRSITKSWLDGLFFAYDDPELPRTNVDIERFIGLVKREVRRLTGNRNIGMFFVYQAEFLAFIVVEELDSLEDSDFIGSLDMLSAHNESLRRLYISPQKRKKVLSQLQD